VGHGAKILARNEAVASRDDAAEVAAKRADGDEDCLLLNDFF